MFLTLFFVGAAWLQSARLRSFLMRIRSCMEQYQTISFYRANYQDISGYDPPIVFKIIGASSEECDNYKYARVADTLWENHVLRGVSILPMQNVALNNKWMKFTCPIPDVNPLYTTKSVDLDSHSDKTVVHILLQMEGSPDFIAANNGSLIVTAEEFGVPIAWKIDRSKVSVVMKSNFTLFTELIKSTFIQNVLYFNNYLPIIRIESITVTQRPLSNITYDDKPTGAIKPRKDSFLHDFRNNIDKMRLYNFLSYVEPTSDVKEKCSDSNESVVPDMRKKPEELTDYEDHTSAVMMAHKSTQSRAKVSLFNRPPY